MGFKFIIGEIGILFLIHSLPFLSINLQFCVLQPAETYEFSGIVYSHHMSTCASEHNLIAVGTRSSQAKMIDMRTGSSIQILKGHSGPVYCVKWSPCLPFVVCTGRLVSTLLIHVDGRNRITLIQLQIFYTSLMVILCPSHVNFCL